MCIKTVLLVKYRIYYYYNILQCIMLYYILIYSILIYYYVILLFININYIIYHAHPHTNAA